MTLTYFMKRSIQAPYAFKWGKLLKCHLKRKSCGKLATGLNINDSEKKDPRDSSAPTPGQYTYIIITIILKNLVL